MTPEYITSLIATGESETLEFKQTTRRRREATQTMCAMLNHRGGHVLFGITPGGKVTGQQVSDRTVEEVSGEIQQLDPPAFPTIERVSVEEDREVIVVGVSQGQMKPYSYRGVAYRRVGNTNLDMSRDEYNQMLFERMHGEQRWENQPAADWSVDDLDIAEIHRTVDEAIRRGRAEDPGTRDPEALLRGLGLIKGGVLLRAAVVLFGTTERIEAEMPQPEIEDVSGCVTVRFRPSQYIPPQRVGRDLTERQQEILAMLDQAGRGLALREIYAQMKLQASERQVRRDLNTLRILELVVPKGHGRGARWNRL